MNRKITRSFDGTIDRVDSSDFSALL